MEIELVPTLTNSSVKSRLEHLFETCQVFKGCTAFWTIDIGFLSSFASALLKPNSFFCADIQLPTNIRKIAEFSKIGVKEIYLHLYRQSPLEYTKNTNLLHSKVLLFQLNDEDAEIWIGSHNFTKYAIGGFNLEASISIKCRTNDVIYSDIENYLENIKTKYCSKFDPTKVEIYEKLQTRDAEKTTADIALLKVVTLVGRKMDHLEKEQIIQLLSVKDSEFSKFKTIGEEIYLHTFDTDKYIETIYQCRIEQSGLFDKTIDKLEFDFTLPRRFAYIGTGALSKLEDESLYTQQIMKISKYFVSVAVIKVVNDCIYEKPGGEDFSFWKSTDENPYIQRSPEDIQIDFTIQKATFDSNISPPKVALTDYWREYGNELKKLYKELDSTIENEDPLTIADAKEASLFDSERNSNEELENLLEQVRKSKKLPHYSKSMIERIILEKDNKSLLNTII
ncbi:hypothetical protein [Runella sp.]|uniref:hypothetical protein n=1 Tax=Runella sp. TaxID=1960881 RepID=UPI00260DEBE3|nr:hypothetical protein [Runella sp.]